MSATRHPMTSPDDPRHGTCNGYSNLGCRCDRCRAAHTVIVLDQRERRSILLAAGLLECEHGSHSTYTNYGCRCAECRSAHNRYTRNLLLLRRERVQS